MTTNLKCDANYNTQNCKIYIWALFKFYNIILFIKYVNYKCYINYLFYHYNYTILITLIVTLERYESVYNYFYTCHN